MGTNVSVRATASPGMSTSQPSFRSTSSDRMPLPTMRANSMAMSRYSRLLPVLTAAKPMPRVMSTMNLPSLVNASLRGKNLLCMILSNSPLRFSENRMKNSALASTMTIVMMRRPRNWGKRMAR